MKIGLVERNSCYCCYCRLTQGHSCLVSQLPGHGADTQRRSTPAVAKPATRAMMIKLREFILRDSSERAVTLEPRWLQLQGELLAGA